MSHCSSHLASEVQDQDPVGEVGQPLVAVVHGLGGVVGGVAQHATAPLVALVHARRPRELLGEGPGRGGAVGGENNAQEADTGTEFR